MSDATPLFWQPVSLELQWKAICPTARHPKTRTPLFPKIHTLPAVVGSATAVHGAEWAWVCPLFGYLYGLIPTGITYPKLSPDTKILKGKFTHKWKFNHYALSLSVERWMRFHSSQNISGASQQNRVAVFFVTNWSREGTFNWGLFKMWREQLKKNIKSFHTARHKSLEAQRSQIDLKIHYLHPQCTSIHALQSVRISAFISMFCG